MAAKSATVHARVVIDIIPAADRLALLYGATSNDSTSVHPTRVAV